MNDQQLTKLLSETYTKAQLLRRVRILKDFVSFRLFNLTPEQLQLKIDAQIQLFLALHQKDLIELNILRQEGGWLVSLGEDFFKTFNLDNFSKLSQDIETFIAKISPVIVYLPVDLPEKNTLELGSWLKQNVGLQTIYEPQFDGNLIGGCALSYKGTYRDYSLRAQINNNKDKVLASLKSFKR